MEVTKLRAWVNMETCYSHKTWADQERGGWGRGSGAPSLENHKWLYVSLEILVRTHLQKQLDPWVQLLLE